MTKINVVMDPDVQKVCEFMQRNMTADRLVSVAEKVGELAPILWGRHGRCELIALRFETEKPIITPRQ